MPLGIKKQVAIYAESMENNYIVDVDLLEATHAGKVAYCQLVGFGFDGGGSVGGGAGGNDLVGA